MTLDISCSVQRGQFDLEVELELRAGAVVAVLGPNGSGKSTLLRAIAGLQPITSGMVALSGKVLDDGSAVFVRPRDRAVGVVFQDYALFPHLSVLENVAFGPRSRGCSRAEARRIASDALDQLNVADLARRRPAEVSGGQAQRVALARALATSPDVLLLDEPMAALDVETRDAVRAQLAAQLAAFEGIAVLVTHDPLDALLLADRVVVLESGRVVQDGTPADLAERPQSDYVAALMGVTLVRGTAAGTTLIIDADGGVLHLANDLGECPAMAVIRPESVTLHRLQPEGSARNVWQGTVRSLQPMHDRVRVFIDGRPPVISTVTPSALAELGLHAGAPVWVSVKAVEIRGYRRANHSSPGLPPPT